MNEAATLASDAAPPLRKPLRARKGLMVLAIFVASLPTALVVLAFPVGNHLADASWRAFRAEWEARGETFALESLLSPEISDDRNFAKAPLIAECFATTASHDGHDHGHDRDHAHPVEAPAAPTRLGGFSVFADGSVRHPTEARALSYVSGMPVELTGFVPAGASESDPLVYLDEVFARHEPVIADLMEAAGREGAHYPVDPARPSATQLAHLPALIPAIHALRVHNLALIASGPDQAEQAAARVIGTLRVIRLGTECEGLASHSIRTMALESAGLEVVWHALLRQRFGDAEWQSIDRELRAYSFGPRLLHALRFERAALIREVENGFERRSARPFSVPPAWVNLAGLLEYGQLTQRHWFTDAAGGRVLTDEPRLPQLAAIEAEVADLETSFENMVLSVGVLPVHDFAQRSRWIEAQRNHALIAIALERHRLARGSLPDRLSDLVPEWLPEIPESAFTTQTPRYERAPDPEGAGPLPDGYRLRSFGDDTGNGVEDPVWILPPAIIK